MWHANSNQKKARVFPLMSDKIHLRAEILVVGSGAIGEWGAGGGTQRQEWAWGPRGLEVQAGPEQEFK